jgi:hypothetical protein
MCFSQILLGYDFKEQKPYSNLKVFWNSHWWWKPTHAIFILYKDNAIEKRRYLLFNDATSITFKVKSNKARYAKVLIRFESPFGCARYKKLRIKLSSKLQPVHDIKYQVLGLYDV